MTRPCVSHQETGILDRRLLDENVKRSDVSARVLRIVVHAQIKRPSVIRGELYNAGSRTAFRSEGEQQSERSDADMVIVEQVFGIVKQDCPQRSGGAAIR